MQQGVTRVFESNKLTVCCEPIPPEDLVKNEFHFFDLQTSKNPLCSGNRAVSTVCSKTHLFIEVEQPNQQMCAHCHVQLGDIPKRLDVLDTAYYLRGVVGFQGVGATVSTIGHYKAYCFRLNQKWEVYDDLKDKPYDVSAKEHVQRCHLFVYTV